MNRPKIEADKTDEASATGAHPHSFLELFRLHEKSLRHYISSFFIRPQDIEDISQETFLRTYKSILKEEVLKPKSFMYRVAKNLILSEFRRSSYKLTEYIDDIHPNSLPIRTNNLEDNIEAQEKLGWFCEALANLPEARRRIMVMRKVYGMSVKEISTRMEMPISTVNWNLAKGITHCDNVVERYEQNKQSKSKHSLQHSEKASRNNLNHSKDTVRLDQ